VKRGLAWLILPVLACVLLWVNRAGYSGMLEDSDTVEIMKVIRERQNPMSWFSGDWPLHNHFYRPISTLTFEYDNWRSGAEAAGYGATNAILVILGVLALYWFVYEATRRAWLAGLSSGLFAVWNMPVQPWTSFIPQLFWVVVLAGVVGLFRNGRRGLGASLLAILAGFYLVQQFGPVYWLYGRMMAWIPGRTASTMLVFCLTGLAAYARYEWESARRRPLAPTSLDLPPTKSTERPPEKPLGTRFIWLAVSLLSTALALGSYEQAVMLPGIAVAIAVYLRTQGYRPNWWFHGANWGVLVGYFALRSQIVSSQVSGYQAQQFRSGAGVWFDLGSYLLPAGHETLTLMTALSSGLLILFSEAPWISFGTISGNLAAYWVAWRDRDRWLIFALLAISGLSYLPMAFLKHFEHYHAWPGAMRAVYLVALAAAVFRAAVIAASPLPKPAPLRSDPAPGSLPHP
jgi:hypothetical protein